MDLKKFLLNKKIEKNAILSLLTGRQAYFLDIMSQMVVRESSNFEWTSSDEQLDGQGKSNVMDKQVRHIANSDSKVDQRLINLFIYQKTHQEGLKFGFKNTVYDKVTNAKF